MDITDCQFKLVWLGVFCCMLNYFIHKAEHKKQKIHLGLVGGVIIALMLSKLLPVIISMAVVR